jgi:hypothetical protein
MLKLLDTESSAFSIVNKCRKDPAPQPHNIKAKSATKPSQGKINTAATYDKILLSPRVSVLLIVPQGESSNQGGGWARRFSDYNRHVIYCGTKKPGVRSFTRLTKKSAFAFALP